MKKSTGIKMNRRRFLAMSGLAVMGTVAATGTYLSINDESKNIVVEKVTIPIKNLHPALEGFTIAQMADFHFQLFSGGFRLPNHHSSKKPSPCATPYRPTLLC